MLPARAKPQCFRVAHKKMPTRSHRTEVILRFSPTRSHGGNCFPSFGVPKNIVLNIMKQKSLPLKMYFYPQILKPGYGLGFFYSPPLTLHLLA